MPLGMEVSLVPGHIVLGGDPATFTERGTATHPHFRNLRTQASLRPYKPQPLSIVAERLDASGCHLVWT